ncbi:MAG: PadR family transcriptional regulator [Acidimicrobiales bacterium]
MRPHQDVHGDFGDEEVPGDDWGREPRVKGPAWWGGPQWGRPQWGVHAHPRAYASGLGTWAGLGSGPGWFFGTPRRGRSTWGRARRGDVRSAVLALLAERPMHGYEIMGELSERTEGLWRPSPGSIYPALQALQNEGLVTADVDDPGGKRRYSLTDKGRAAASALGQAPWEDVAAGVSPNARALRRAVAKLMPVVGQVFMNGGPYQYEQAIKVLDDARQKLYAVLAEGEPPQATPASGPTAEPD